MAEWPHQTYALAELSAAILRGERRILLTIPTGGGKTSVASELARIYLDEDRKVIFYTNRKMLLRQTSKVMQLAGHDHGVRAAGHRDERELNFQVSSIQTEGSRVLRGQQWALHEASLVLVDEAHQMTGKDARRILNAHHEQGAVIVGLTATPLGLADMFDSLVVAGTTSELRHCGALVPAIHYAPDEPDMKGIKAAMGEDLTEKEAVKAVMRNGIFARVMESFLQLNPAQTPTLLFAPGVKESVWFAEQFSYPEKREPKYRGLPAIRAAHIDGAEVWLDGEFVKTSQDARDEVLQGSRDGSIKVICNRFVMREGIDAPWIEHLILATVIGSLQSYIQIVGRGLRASPLTEKLNCTIQDHGGNWHRHGSANADREWSLELTDAIATGLRQERMRAKKQKEPFRCRQCGKVLMSVKCSCGFDNSGPKTRPVVQSDGTLKLVGGDIFRPRRISRQPNGRQIWEKMYYRSKTTKGDRTFRAAMALFAQENNWQYPDPSWPYMPVEEWDHFRKVADVPMERLVPK